MHPWHRWHRLGLTGNPFAEEPSDRTAARARLALPPLLSFLDRPGRRVVQLLADDGRGKSTCLLALAAALQAPLHRGTRASPRATTTLCLDEADGIDPITRWRWLRHPRKAALTSHADLSLSLRAMGFTVLTHRPELTDHDALAQVLRDRIQRASSAPVHPTLPDPVIAALQHRHGTDVRAMEDVLYVAFQQLDHVRPLTPDDLSPAPPPTRRTRVRWPL